MFSTITALHYKNAQTINQSLCKISYAKSLTEREMCLTQVALWMCSKEYQNMCWVGLQWR